MKYCCLFNFINSTWAQTEKHCHKEYDYKMSKTAKIIIILKHT